MSYPCPCRQCGRLGRYTAPEEGTGASARETETRPDPTRAGHGLVGWLLGWVLAAALSGGR